MEPLIILLVEDDITFRETLARVLRAAGHIVREADGAAQALRSLQIGSPDVVITDIMMPDGDGLELINGIKATHSDTLVVAMSGRRRLGSVDLLGLAGKLGAHAVLCKPFSVDELLLTLENLLPSPNPPAS